jgi:hypothetical protein
VSDFLHPQSIVLHGSPEISNASRTASNCCKRLGSYTRPRLNTTWPPARPSLELEAGYTMSKANTTSSARLCPLCARHSSSKLCSTKSLQLKRLAGSRLRRDSG